jgi:hypothetical protein
MRSNTFCGESLVNHVGAAETGQFMSAADRTLVGNHVGGGPLAVSIVQQQQEDPNSIEYYQETHPATTISAAGAATGGATAAAAGMHIGARPPYIKYNSFANY